MKEAARRGDRYELARLDTVYHRQLCGLTGNEVLLRTWEPLSLQLTIIFGLSAMQKDLGPIADEHTDILEALRSQGCDEGRSADARAHRRLHARARS